MTNEEITKGLEICSHPYNNRYTCGDCPYYDTKNCIGVLLSDARNRIIEQEQEFKQLETNAEILARGVRDLNHENYKLTEKVKQAKIDVLQKVKRYIIYNADYICKTECGEYAKVNFTSFEKHINEMIAEVQNAKNKG